MGLVVLLILLGVFFLVVELIFLPGVTLGTILSVASYGAAIYLAFDRFGFVGGMITLFVVVALSLVATVVSLRAKTWQRLALNDKVDGMLTASSSTGCSDTITVHWSLCSATHCVILVASAVNAV